MKKKKRNVEGREASCLKEREGKERKRRERMWKKEMRERN